MEISLTLVHIWESIFIIYTLVYNAITIFLIFGAWLRVRFLLRLDQIIEYDNLYRSPFAPSVALIVPAFNEQHTIVDTMRSLFKLKYQNVEFIIVNDGSTDETVDELIKAFHFVRRDVSYAETLPTARVRGFYEAMAQDQDHKIRRIILIDKENGGKADSLNCGVNAALSPYICCVDADTIIDPMTLLEIMQPIVESTDKIVASGGQVAIFSRSATQGDSGQRELPKSWLAMFQLVEYMRSFTISRTGLAGFNLLLILCGVFAVFNRKLICDVGGFLSGKNSSKIALEYCGQKTTVADDIEIIVRLQRYLKEKELPGRILFLPYPIVWTQAVNNLKDYGKQRSRWYRGLLQVLFFHKKLLFNPKYGKIGLFAMPYLYFFEAIGPILELLGYISVPILYFLGLLNFDFFLLLLILSVLTGVLISLVAVLIGIWSEGKIAKDRALSSLFHFEGFRNKLKVLSFSMLSMVGYRQMQIYFQLKGFIDYFRGVERWDKFKHDKFES